MLCMDLPAASIMTHTRDTEIFPPYSMTVPCARAPVARFFFWLGEQEVAVHLVEAFGAVAVVYPHVPPGSSPSDLHSAGFGVGAGGGGGGGGGGEGCAHTLGAPSRAHPQMDAGVSRRALQDFYRALGEGKSAAMAAAEANDAQASRLAAGSEAAGDARPLLVCCSAA